MGNWSNLLCKSSISSFIIDDIIEECENKIPAGLIQSLQTIVKNKEDFKLLKTSVAELKPSISEGLYEVIKEELREIKEDTQWVKTKRGQYVSKLNDWLQPFHSEFNAIKEFEKVYIGGHTEKIVVFVTGKVRTEESYERLVNYVSSKNPPFKMFVQVEINML